MLPMLSPPKISRSCQRLAPRKLAFTRTFAPIAERFDTVPSSFTFSHALVLPSLWKSVEVLGVGANTPRAPEMSRNPSLS
jgi:hypothetical protein